MNYNHGIMSINKPHHVGRFPKQLKPNCYFCEEQVECVEHGIIQNIMWKYGSLRNDYFTFLGGRDTFFIFEQKNDITRF